MREETMRDRSQFSGIVKTLCQTCHEKGEIQAKVKNGRLVQTMYSKCEKGTYLHELLHNPNVVPMLMDWWFPELPGSEHGCFESNVNTIISDGPPFAEINGHAQMRGIMCRAGKVDLPN